MNPKSISQLEFLVSITTWACPKLNLPNPQMSTLPLNLFLRSEHQALTCESSLTPFSPQMNEIINSSNFEL